MPTVIVYLNRRYIYISALSTENPSNKFMWTKILQLQFDDMNECINMREEIRNDLIDMDCISIPKDPRNLSFFFVENMLILQDYFRNKFNIYDIDMMLNKLSDDDDDDNDYSHTTLSYDDSDDSDLINDNDDSYDDSDLINDNDDSYDDSDLINDNDDSYTTLSYDDDDDNIINDSIVSYDDMLYNYDNYDDKDSDSYDDNISE